MAEQQTGRLTKIPIDFRITQAEKTLQAGCGECGDGRMALQIRQLNQRVLHLLRGLIMFKEKILQQVTSCRLFTANYPLLKIIPADYRNAGEEPVHFFRKYA